VQWASMNPELRPPSWTRKAGKSLRAVIKNTLYQPLRVYPGIITLQRKFDLPYTLLEVTLNSQNLPVRAH